MKHLYWRPRKTSRVAIFAVGLLAVTGITAVECFKAKAYRPYYGDKLAAAELAEKCFQEIREERVRRGHPIDAELDPARSGLVGLVMSPITSIAGHLKSKQTSVNPNFAAVVVEMLRDAGVRPGDRIAVGYSGSFPAINTSVCAACETLKVRPIIVSSAGASQYGANFPDFLWIDMEHLLHERGLISFRSSATSYGGREDRGLGMSDASRKLIRNRIDENGLEFLDVGSYTESIDRRMAIYEQGAEGTPIRAYINVGGGTVSVGRSLGKRIYQPGLNLETPPLAMDLDCIMTRFSRQGVPVIHLVNFTDIAQQFGLPTPPLSPPQVGDAGVFFARQHSRMLAGVVLIGLLLSTRWLLQPKRRPRVVPDATQPSVVPMPHIKPDDKKTPLRISSDRSKVHIAEEEGWELMV